MLILLLAVVILFAPFVGRADEIKISRFSSEGLTGWETRSFKGNTEYKLTEASGRIVVKAASRAAASGLIKKIHFDPRKYRFLRWSWKIAHTIKDGDERTKAGDDYAARIYVVFTGRFFWQTKAVNYIWANKLSKGEFASSPFTAGSRMIAVETGNEKAGQWVNEERDLVADYRLLFGTEPPEAEAIAVMTDTDNTGGAADAWYGDITLSTVSN